jgi:hypothetical protein
MTLLSPDIAHGLHVRSIRSMELIIVCHVVAPNGMFPLTHIRMIQYPQRTVVAPTEHNCTPTGVVGTDISRHLSVLSFSGPTAGTCRTAREELRWARMLAGKVKEQGEETTKNKNRGVRDFI